MRPIHQNHTRDSLLRFVFDDKVVSLNVADNVTLGEVAAALGDLSPWRYGAPVAIDLTRTH